MRLDLVRDTIFQARRKNILSRLFPKESELFFRSNSASELDRFFFELLGMSNTRCLLECGAHEASASLRFAESGGEAIAIEANPLTFQNLTSLASRDSIKVLNVGLGSSEGDLKFFIPEYSRMAGNATFQPKAGETYFCQHVTVTTIDSVVAKHILDGDCSIALWIDVEGFARDVLEGARITLKGGQCKVIKIELEDFPFFEGQALANEVITNLHEFGFEPVRFDFEYDMQYNVIFVKTELLDAIMSDHPEFLKIEPEDNFNLRGLLRYSGAICQLKVKLKGAIISIIGAGWGNRLAAAFGSKTSAQFVKDSVKSCR
jgi:FkbM family methyltransferase